MKIHVFCTHPDTHAGVTGLYFDDLFFCLSLFPSIDSVIIVQADGHCSLRVGMRLHTLALSPSYYRPKWRSRAGLTSDRFTLLGYRTFMYFLFSSTTAIHTDSYFLKIPFSRCVLRRYVRRGRKCYEAPT